MSIFFEKIVLPIIAFSVILLRFAASFEKTCINNASCSLTARSPLKMYCSQVSRIRISISRIALVATTSLLCD